MIASWVMYMGCRLPSAEVLIGVTGEEMAIFGGFISGKERAVWRVEPKAKSLDRDIGENSNINHLKVETTTKSHLPLL